MTILICGVVATVGMATGHARPRPPSSGANATVVRMSTMQLDAVSSIGPRPGVIDNPLPAFFWQGLGIEGSMYSYSGPYSGNGVPPYKPPVAGPGSSTDRSDVALERQCDADGACRGAPCEMCHAPGFDGVSLLPWTRQDMWGCERQPQQVPAIEVENDDIKALITPQYGGKVWSVYHKKLGREFFMRNPALQPADYSMRKAWVSGGIEWNWTPGFCGHSTFTLSPVYSATVPTERGEIIRVWEYDRVNHTVWSVDMLFQGDTLWVHPRITNPSKTHDLNGYWWTNVGQQISVAGTERVVMPAKYDYTGVPWPTGNYFLPEGAVGENNGVDGGAQNFSGLSFGSDYSQIGNLPSGHDFFMRLCDNETAPPIWGAQIPKHCKAVKHRTPAMPYISLAQGDGTTVVHAHRGAGTKFFFHERTTGANFVQRFMAGATPATAAGSGEPDSSSKGLYLEAQTGVAPSQSHVFPLPKNSSVEWTEWFRAFQADKQAIHSSNYSEALSEVEDWIDSDAGVPQSRFEDMEKFMDAHSADAIKPENILTHGLPWGGLQEELTGIKLADGVVFDTPKESLAAAAAEPADRDAIMVVSAVRPWYELLTDGKFSNRSLSSLPGSFQVSQAWYDLLQTSMAQHRPTWLHYLFIGTIELERAHAKQALESLSVSHKLRPNPHAARALALLAPTPQEAWNYYLKGWSALQPKPRTSSGSETFGDSDTDPLRDVVMDSLLREICEFCRATGMLSELRSFLSDVSEEKLRHSDAVQYSTALLAMNSSDWKTAMATIGNHCWPVYVSSQHLGLLTNLWEMASYARYAEEEGLSPTGLTPLHGQKARLKYPPPRNIGGHGIGVAG